MTSPQRRSKKYGYAVEVAALKALRRVFPSLARTGSIAYKKAAADLLAPGFGDPLRLVVTRDKGRRLLVSLSVDDLVRLCESTTPHEFAVAVQVKGRERTWLGSLYEELRTATR